MVAESSALPSPATWGSGSEKKNEVAVAVMQLGAVARSSGELGHLRGDYLFQPPEPVLRFSRLLDDSTGQLVCRRGVILI
jgi:hypothetical protein